MQPIFEHLSRLFSVFVVLVVTFSAVPLAAQRFSDITISHFENFCIKCRCYWDPPTGCTADLISPDDCSTCGPLYFTVWAWQDSSLPEFNKVIPWNETHEVSFWDAIKANDTFKMEEFRKCVTKLDCAIRTAMFYSNKYKRDCNGDGKYDCSDAMLINRHGPTNCNTSDGDIKNHDQCYQTLLLEAEVASSGFMVEVVVPVAVVLVVVVGGATGGWFYRRWRRKRVAQLSGGLRIKRTNGQGTLADGPLQIPISAIIPPNELQIENSAPIGEGQFGKVYRGTYNNTLVAIKAPKIEVANNALIADLKKELEMMSKLGDHEFIVKLYGAEVSGIRRGEAYIVMEFSLYGALVDYLRRHSPKPKFSGSSEADTKEEAEGGASCIKTNTQLLWAEQIATGIAFLESKSLLHGDLAARNVLVFRRDLVKISDFGFARHLGNYEFYQKEAIALPWRWMPPECLKQRLFSIKSDVWSFAITVWEIFTFGTVPYLEFPTWSLDFVTHLADGRYLAKPDEMLQEVYSICLQCWSLYPNRRPSFATLLRQFHELQNCSEVRQSIPSKKYESVAGANNTGRPVNFYVNSA